jgi:hypothetical protein
LSRGRPCRGGGRHGSPLRLANGIGRRRLRRRGSREELRVSSTEAGNGTHVLPPIVADHLEHAPDRHDHVPKYLDLAAALRGRQGRQLLEEILHHEGHGGDHGVPVQGGGAFEPVGYHHKWVDQP